MNIGNPFDTKIESMLATPIRPLPKHLAEAAIHVIETLDLAWAGARAVFGDDRATPEIALAILDRIEADRRARGSGIAGG